MTEHDSLSPTDTVSGEGWYSNDAATFGDRIAAAREALGFSQSDVARKLGVKLRTVEGWEDDLSEPRANKLQMLAGLLNVSLMWLLNGTGDGVSGPVETTKGTRDITELLAEIRQIKGTITHAGEKLGGLEKRLRRALQEDAL